MTKNRPHPDPLPQGEGAVIGRRWSIWRAPKPSVPRYFSKSASVSPSPGEVGRGAVERSSLYSAFAHKIVSVLCLFIVIFTAPAAEIEKMIDALASPRETSDYGNQLLRASLSRGEQNFSRAEFLKKPDRFQPAIEHADAGTHD